MKPLLSHWITEEVPAHVDRRHCSFFSHPGGRGPATSAAARVYFLGDKKTINPKIAFLGWERFFILSPKNRSNQLILPYHLL
jgi:hypothetical protein